ERECLLYLTACEVVAAQDDGGNGRPGTAIAHYANIEPIGVGVSANGSIRHCQCPVRSPIQRVLSNSLLHVPHGLAPAPRVCEEGIRPPHADVLWRFTRF